MKIKEVNTTLYRVPLLRPSEDSLHGQMTSIELITIDIITEGGLTGYGYAYTIGVGGTAIKHLLDDYLAEMLIGEDSGMIEHLWQKMWWGIHWVGRGGLASFALAAIDLALWDLAAKAANLPLYRLLGGFKIAILTTYLWQRG